MANENESERLLADILREFRTKFGFINERIDALFVAINAINEQLKDNGDTTPEQVTEYMNKTARMLASRHFTRVHDTLQGMFDWMEEHGHVTKRMMRAIDRIAEQPKNRDQRPPARPWGDDDDWVDLWGAG